MIRGYLRVQAAGDKQSHEAIDLLHAVAQQLKVPLTTIARQAELGQFTGDTSLSELDVIRTHASAALTLVDSYLLGLQLMRDQSELLLEPVSVSSVLVETAHELDGLAKQYNMILELRIDGRYAPVMAHRLGLKSALLALGHCLLENGPAQERSDQRIILAAHRTPHGIVTGLYGTFERITADSWRGALRLQTKTSQPVVALADNGAGLFIADAILQSMASRLRAGKYLHKRGLAATLQPSQQLSFV